MRLLARAGHGQVVAVVGEPGVGKSRLFWEFTRSHRRQGWLIVESGSVSCGKATAHLPVIELLKTCFETGALTGERRAWRLEKPVQSLQIPATALAILAARIDRLFPDLQFTFKHALTHDVSCRSLVHDRRCDLHRRIMEAIERLAPGHLSRERLGLHAFPAALVGHYPPWALSELDEFNAAVARARDAIQVAEAVDHPYSLAVAQRG